MSSSTSPDLVSATPNNPAPEVKDDALAGKDKVATTSPSPSTDANYGQQGGASTYAAGAGDRVHNPQVAVEGGKCTITHFDLLQVGVSLGQGDDVANMTSFPASAVKTLVLNAKDHAGRLALAGLLETIAGQLRG